MNIILQFVCIISENFTKSKAWVVVIRLSSKHSVLNRDKMLTGKLFEENSSLNQRDL